MKLTFFRTAEPNFGDELNTLLWRHLVPSGFLDERDDELFLGIGSIIWDTLPKSSVKHVIGSGYGGYTGPPDVHDGSWNIVWVRGPQTAKTLGIDPKCAITDAAVLLRAIPLPPPADGIDIAFMPHFHSVRRGDWARVCKLAGITFLDPRDEPEKLIAQIRGASCLLTEAMHGAIVADALRTPFIPFLPHHPHNRSKWLDWAESLNLDLNSQPMPASTGVELYVKMTGAIGQGPRAQMIRDGWAFQPLHRALSYVAAKRLQTIAATITPLLSDEAVLETATDRCMEALESFIISRQVKVPL